jgi:hypothetical protein
VSEIVLGIGTSHSPLLTLDAESWAERASDDVRNGELTLSDGRTLTYADLLAETGGCHSGKSTPETFEASARGASEALDRLANEIARAAPDVALIVGDDQGELFSKTNMPAVSIYYGEEIVMHPLPLPAKPPRWLNTAVTAYAMDAAHRYPAAPQLAQTLIEGLLERGVDVGAASQIVDPAAAGFGHAFGFIIERLFGKRRIPVLPILLNTYYPPNVPRPGRCYDIGSAIRATLHDDASEARVVVIASGGLSHFVTDESLDRTVLDAFRDRDSQSLREIPMKALRAGSSEILCWIMAAGALQDIPHRWSRYIPVYRTPAGTGIGLAFSVWHQEPI